MNGGRKENKDKNKTKQTKNKKRTKKERQKNDSKNEAGRLPTISPVVEYKCTRVCVWGGWGCVRLWGRGVHVCGGCMCVGRGCVCVCRGGGGDCGVCVCGGEVVRVYRWEVGGACVLFWCDPATEVTSTFLPLPQPLFTRCSSSPSFTTR